jgi:hypothetical protein
MSAQVPQVADTPLDAPSLLRNSKLEEEEILRILIPKLKLFVSLVK